MRTPIMKAGVHGNVEAIKVLVEIGAEVNARDDVSKFAVFFLLKAQTLGIDAIGEHDIVGHPVACVCLVQCTSIPFSSATHRRLRAIAPLYRNSILRFCLPLKKQAWQRSKCCWRTEPTSRPRALR